MSINICSIKKLKYILKNESITNIKAILVSSNDDIEEITNDNKLVLHFDDVVELNDKSIKIEDAKAIKQFIESINIKDNSVYVCCDSGESRSAAIAAVLYRLNGFDEDEIWENPIYHPNILVYKTLCDEFRLKNTKFRLWYKQYINNKALKNKIKEARK